jgi:NTP pyrophosphatase (non-canonical NTP hydrolase)
MAIPILNDEEVLEVLQEVKEGLGKLEQLFDEIGKRIFFNESVTRSNPNPGTS